MESDTCLFCFVAASVGGKVVEFGMSNAWVFEYAEWERADAAELRLREAELRAEAAEKMVKTMQHGEFLAEVRAIRAESCLEEAELGAAVAVARAEKAEAELTEQCERARSERACGELGEMPVPMELGDIVRKLEMFEMGTCSDFKRGNT